MNKRLIGQCLLSYLPALAIFSVIYLLVIYLASTSSFYSYWPNPGVEVLTVFPLIVAPCLPFMAESYRYSRRSTDVYYSFPIKRKTLWLTRHLTMLLAFLALVLIIYLLGLLNGIVIAQTRPQDGRSPLHYGYYFPLLLVLLLFLSAHYLVGAFFAKVSLSFRTGVIHYASALLFAFLYFYIAVVLVQQFDGEPLGAVLSISIDPVSTMIILSRTFAARIVGNPAIIFSPADIAYTVIHCLALATIAVFAFLAKQPSGELCGTSGDNEKLPLRILTFIPAFTFALALTSIGGFLGLIPLGVYCYVLAAIYERRFKLSRLCWMGFGIALLSGFLLGLTCYVITVTVIDDPTIYY